jgi:hypothetical protein
MLVTERQLIEDLLKQKEIFWNVSRKNIFRDCIVIVERIATKRARIERRENGDLLGVDWPFPRL